MNNQLAALIADLQDALIDCPDDGADFRGAHWED